MGAMPSPTWPRNCPRCGSPPARVYRDYPAGKRLVRQAYCSSCKRTYGPGPAVYPPKPEKPKQGWRLVEHRVRLLRSSRRRAPRSEQLALFPMAVPDPIPDASGAAPVHDKCKRRHLPDLPCWAGTYARLLKDLCLATYGDICHLCGHAGATSVDHIRPRALGGSDDIDNLLPAHAFCNTGRGALPIQWFDRGVSG